MFGAGVVTGLTGRGMRTMRFMFFGSLSDIFPPSLSFTSMRKLTIQGGDIAI